MLDFKGLSQILLGQSRSLLPAWLPGGKLVGSEYCCGDLTGTPGQSLKVNVNTGKWADFAAGDQGGDLISLYAAINGVDQKQAFIDLSKDNNFKQDYKPRDVTPKPEPVSPLIIPPKNTPMPNFKEYNYVWQYKTLDGLPWFYIARKDLKSGKKTITPHTWCGQTKQWIFKAWPKERPLYNLHEIKLRPTAPIMVVEGEKAADAAREFITSYVVVSWSGGSNAINKTDWSPLKGKSILLWPDQDLKLTKDKSELLPYAEQPGAKAMFKIAEKINDMAGEVKIINVKDSSKIDGFDAADTGFTEQSHFIEWAKPRASLYKPPALPSIEKPMIQETPPMPDGPPLDYYENQPPPPTTVNNLYVGEDAVPDKVPTALQAMQMEMGLMINGQGNAHANIANFHTVFTQHKLLKNKIWYDEFHNSIMTTFSQKKDIPVEWDDFLTIKLTRFMQQNLGIVRANKNSVYDAVFEYARDNVRNEPKEWINSLEWDGVDRIGQFFQTYYGTRDNEYYQHISKFFLISIVARLMKPGCQVDTMIMLEGKQGARKSTSLKALAGSRWFGETSTNPNNKDFFQELQGILLMEVAELDSFYKASKLTIKKILSTAEDRFRTPYDKHPQRHPRQCVFAGTTNDNQYLSDPTGARRFWPVEVGSIDIDGIRKDREQLFAEALHRYKKGELWWREDGIPGELEMQHSKREVDAWEEDISAFLEKRLYTWNGELYGPDCLEIPKERRNKLTASRINAVMKMLGWTRVRKNKRVHSGESVLVWIKPGLSEGNWEQIRVDQDVSPKMNYPAKYKNHAPIY